MQPSDRSEASSALFGVGVRPSAWAQALGARTRQVAAQPSLILEMDRAAALHAIGPDGVPGPVQEQGLALLAAVVAGRPDLIDDGVPAALAAFLSRRALPGMPLERAANLLCWLVGSPVRDTAARALLTVVTGADVAEPARDAAVRALAGGGRLDPDEGARAPTGGLEASPEDGRPTVLILTPVKDAADCLDGYFQRLRALSYPHHLLAVGLLEGDSTDTTYADLLRHAEASRPEFRRVGVWKRDHGFRLPLGVPRWAPEVQVRRRSVLAKCRNELLFRALGDEAWVLWLDVDVVEYPPDLIERLLATGREIVQPHCVLERGGPSFDRNAWRDHGRLHLDDLRAEGELVELDAVGGTALLVRADIHREGLVFPTFLYGTANPRIRAVSHRPVGGPVAGEIETEGLGIMARDMGYRCWGLPHLEVVHRRA